MEETIFKPKKRIFIALTSISAVIGALMIYVVWKVTVPGLQQIHYLLPKFMGVVGGFIAFAMVTGVIGIVLAHACFRKKTSENGVLKFATVYSNCGFMGLPFLQSLFTEASLQAELVIYCAVVLAVLIF